MKKYNEEFELTQEELDNIATYMDDEIREDVAFDLAPCTPEEFFKRVCKQRWTVWGFIKIRV